MLFLDLLFCKVQMKLNALTDARHSDEEIGRRLSEIDDDIRKAEAPPSRSLLPCPAPSVTAVTRLPVPHRLHPPRLLHPHQADGQRGAGGDVGERGVPIPVRGCLSVADAHARVQIPGGDSYSTDCRNIVEPDVQPLTGLWGMVGNIIVLQICKP